MSIPEGCLGKPPGRDESALNLQVTSADTRYGVVTLWNTMPKKKAVWHLSYPWRLPSVQDEVMHKLIHKTCESIIVSPKGMTGSIRAGYG